MTNKAYSEAEASKLIKDLPDWDLGVEGRAIHCEQAFKDFKTALAFVNKVGELAESANHHPDINFGYDYVDITLCTHSADGLTDKDFALAKKISSVLN